MKFMVRIGKVKKRHYRQKIQEVFLENIKQRNYTRRTLSTLKSNKYYIVIFSFIFIIFSFTFFEVSSNQFDNYIESSSEKILTNQNSVTTYTNSSVLGETTEIDFTVTEEKKSEFVQKDPRVYVLDEYFKTRNSPLVGYAEDFVKECDHFGAPKDCIVIPAIARHETDLCTYYNSGQMHNCMGWGGGGSNRMTFSSFEEHIRIATDVLVNQYGNQYLIDPSLMERTFCGPQEECDNWGNRIKGFVREIDDFGVSLGVGRLTDLRNQE